MVYDDGITDLVAQFDHGKGLDRLRDLEIGFLYHKIAQFVGAVVDEARVVEPSVRGRVVLYRISCLIFEDVGDDRVELDPDVAVRRVVEVAEAPVDVDFGRAVVGGADRLGRREGHTVLVFYDEAGRVVDQAFRQSVVD